MAAALANEAGALRITPPQESGGGLGLRVQGLGFREPPFKELYLAGVNRIIRNMVPIVSLYDFAYPHSVLTPINFKGLRKEIVGL